MQLLSIMGILRDLSEGIEGQSEIRATMNNEFDLGKLSPHLFHLHFYK